MCRYRERDRGVNARQLFDADTVIDGPEPGPAIALGNLYSHQPQGTETRKER